jgi:disulfide bond formation protein DsbB
MTLSEEFTPTLAPDAGLVLSPKRTLDELFVTGACVADGSLYALSAAYSTLLKIDPVSHRVTAAYAIPGLVAPTGLAAKGEELYIIGQDGRVWVVGKK